MISSIKNSETHYLFYHFYEDLCDSKTKEKYSALFEIYERGNELISGQADWTI